MATSSRTPRAPRIFISHTHKDNDFGIQLVDDLRRTIGDEAAVWYDSRGGLKGGDSWWSAIVREIKRRNTFIVILSPNSFRSNWVRKEIALGWQEHVRKKKRIIPILYQPCKVPDDLQTLHTISFLPDRTYKEAFQELEVALHLSKSFENPKNVSFLNDYRKSNIQQTILEIEMAYHKGNWSYIIEKVNAIANQSPEVMLPSLYCMQGWAYYFEDQPSLAQEALKKGIKLIQDPKKQLTLLDAYAAQFVPNGQWDELLACASEALQLDPHNSTWQMAKIDASTKILKNGSFSPKQLARHPASDKATTKAEIGTSSKDNTEVLTNITGYNGKDEVHERYDSRTSLENSSIQDIELQIRKLTLQKEQFQLEKEIMTFAFEMAERVSAIPIDKNGSTKAELLQAFLPQFLSLEDKKKT